MGDPPRVASLTATASLPSLSDATLFDRPPKRRYTSPTAATAYPLTASANTTLTSTATAPTSHATATTTTLVSSTMSSFNPKPYYPSSTNSSRSFVHTRAHARNPGAVAHLPTLDPTPDDPDAVFIHPPFTDFPDAHKYKEGLTYNVLAVNPDWFLDSSDYQQLNGVNLEGTKYPPQLEPPRGWCPAKKREAKDGWAEGEEPRLRCTFCRRTYAGVNAKSMWRRHVFEKHKIAMSNRRENAERKGRGSNKENKEGSTRSSGSTARGAAKVETQPASAPSSSSSRSAYRLRPAGRTASEWSSRASDVEDSSESEEDEDSGAESNPPAPNFALPEEMMRRATTPPLTPALSPSSSSSVSRSFEHTNAVPQSPYNPLLTPSFKHSPAHLPDRPWLYATPSHPLHSLAREKSLCAIAQAEASPVVRGLDVSPVILVPREERSKQSIYSSPLSLTDRPKDFTLLTKATPGRLLSEAMLPTPFNERIKAAKGEQAPASKGSPVATIGFTPIKRKYIPLLTPLSGAWCTSSPAKSPPGKGLGLMGPIELSDGRTVGRDDPFAEPYRPWPVSPDSADERDLSPPDSSPEAESPILRSSQLVQSQGDSSLDSSLGSLTSDSSVSSTFSAPAGLGLLDAFSLKETPSTPDDSDDEDHLILPKIKDVDFEMSIAQSSSPLRAGCDGSPLPLILAGKKTRREVFFASAESPNGPQAKKRRRTASSLSD